MTAKDYLEASIKLIQAQNNLSLEVDNPNAYQSKTYWNPSWAKRDDFPYEDNYLAQALSYMTTTNKIVKQKDHYRILEEDMNYTNLKRVVFKSLILQVDSRSDNPFQDAYCLIGLIEKIVTSWLECFQCSLNISQLYNIKTLLLLMPLVEEANLKPLVLFMAYLACSSF